MPHSAAGKDVQATHNLQMRRSQEANWRWQSRLTSRRIRTKERDIWTQTMSAQTEIMQLREVFFNQAQNAAQVDQAFSGVKSLVGDLAVGFMLPFSAAMFLFLVAALFYHPRLTRGALWIPAFGLFGGSPKLYSHTRPASFLGLFLSSRKRKGATRVFRKAS